MKTETEALRDARAAVEEVRDDLHRRRRGPNAEERQQLVRKLTQALVEMTTADIASGRRGWGAALVEVSANLEHERKRTIEDALDVFLQEKLLGDNAPSADGDVRPWNVKADYGDALDIEFYADAEHEYELWHLKADGTATQYQSR